MKAQYTAVQTLKHYNEVLKTETKMRNLFCEVSIIEKELKENWDLMETATREKDWDKLNKRNESLNLLMLRFNNKMKKLGAK